MADVVNLRTLRKRSRRQDDERVAQANRLSHGQPKHLRTLNDARQAKALRDLDAHRQQKEEEKEGERS